MRRGGWLEDSEPVNVGVEHRLIERTNGLGEVSYHIQFRLNRRFGWEYYSMLGGTSSKRRALRVLRSVRRAELAYITASERVIA